MAQTAIPIWIPIVFGGGGLVGASAFLFNLFKQVTDAKDDRIKGLEREVENLERSHGREMGILQRELEAKKQELEKIGDFRQLIEEAVDDLAKQGITSQTNSSLRRIESVLLEMQGDRELLKNSQVAAQWVERRQEEWLRRATEAALSQCPDLIPESQRAPFEQDIANYLKWLHRSLELGFFCRLEDYVRIPAIESPFPYREAFQELREMNDFGRLRPGEIQYLQEYIDELIHSALD